MGSSRRENDRTDHTLLFVALIQESGLNWRREDALNRMWYWPLIYTGIYASKHKDLWLCPPLTIFLHQDWNFWYLKWILKYETITNECNLKDVEFVWDVKWWGRERFNPLCLKPVQERINPFSFWVPMRAAHSVNGLYYLHCTLGPSHSLAALLWSCWNGMGDALSITDDETTLTHCSPKVVALKSDKILFFFFNA